MSSPEQVQIQPSPWKGWQWRVFVLLVCVAAASALTYVFREELTIESLARREMLLREYYGEHPWQTLALAFVAYVVLSGLSIPGAAVMTIAYGRLFGFWPALVLVSFASTLGATIAFLLSRYLYGEVIQAYYAERLAGFNARVEREGALYLLTLRLVPQVPYVAVNFGMGLTKMRVSTFWWVSQLGMLPATCAFVFAGSSAPSLRTIADRGLLSVIDWRFFAALTVLGILPLALKKLVDWLNRRKSTA